MEKTATSLGSGAKDNATTTESTTSTTGVNSSNSGGYENSEGQTRTTQDDAQSSQLLEQLQRVQQLQLQQLLLQKQQKLLGQQQPQTQTESLELQRLLQEQLGLSLKHTAQLGNPTFAFSGLPISNFGEQELSNTLLGMAHRAGAGAAAAAGAGVGVGVGAGAGQQNAAESLPLPASNALNSSMSTAAALHTDAVLREFLMKSIQTQLSHLQLQAQALNASTLGSFPGLMGTPSPLTNIQDLVNVAAASQGVVANVMRESSKPQQEQEFLQMPGLNNLNNSIELTRHSDLEAQLANFKRWQQSRANESTVAQNTGETLEQSSKRQKTQSSSDHTLKGSGTASPSSRATRYGDGSHKIRRRRERSATTTLDQDIIPGTLPKRRNRPKRENCTSLFRGVSWHTRDRRWIARIWIKGKVRHLGNFLCERKAALAVDELLLAAYGDKVTNSLNFPSAEERAKVAQAEERPSTPPPPELLERRELLRTKGRRPASDNDSEP